jgi:hypothetical protein
MSETITACECNFSTALCQDAIADDHCLIFHHRVLIVNRAQAHLQHRAFANTRVAGYAWYSEGHNDGGLKHHPVFRPPKVPA